LDYDVAAFRLGWRRRSIMILDYAVSNKCPRWLWALCRWRCRPQIKNWGTLLNLMVRQIDPSLGWDDEEHL
jgi:hypothetical protein